MHAKNVLLILLFFLGIYAFTRFTHIKNKCISERERKLILSVFVKYIGAFFFIINVIYLIRVVKIVLIRVIIKKSN